MSIIVKFLKKKSKSIISMWWKKKNVSKKQSPNLKIASRNTE